MRVLLVPYTFVLMNWAAVAGLYHFARRSKDVWLNRSSSAPRAERANRRISERNRSL